MHSGKGLLRGRGIRLGFLSGSSCVLLDSPRAQAPCSKGRGLAVPALPPAARRGPVRRALLLSAVVAATSSRCQLHVDAPGRRSFLLSAVRLYPYLHPAIAAMHLVSGASCNMSHLTPRVPFGRVRSTSAACSCRTIRVLALRHSLLKIIRRSEAAGQRSWLHHVSLHPVFLRLPLSAEFFSHSYFFLSS